MAKNRILQLLDEINKDGDVSEFIINSTTNIYYEKEGVLSRLDVKFSSDEIHEFCQEIAKFNRKIFNEENAILDGNLPDGSRINLVHRNYTNTGTHAITVRRYSNIIKTFDESPDIFTLSKDWITFFKYMINARMNIIVSGGTGVGKTTFLNLLLQEIPESERIITIEDTRELQFQHANIVRLEARPDVGDLKGLTVRDLLKNSLRMRPDRVIVGECRGGEVFDLLQAMNTGHEGSMTSIHANSPREALMRLENLYLLSGYDLPLKALRYQIISAVDYLIQIARDATGKRYISHVTEVTKLEGDQILSQDVGVYKDGELVFTGLVPSGIAHLYQVGLPRNFFQDL
jgi:pilus assembly protein CpaF